MGATASQHDAGRIRVEVDVKVTLTLFILLFIFLLPGGSGGPVFVRRSIKTLLDDKKVDGNPAGIKIWVHGSLWLLGVWTDAWFGDPSKILRLPAGKGFKVPLGIGVAVPATKLIGILDHPRLVANRKAFEEKNKKSRQKKGSG